MPQIYMFITCAPPFVCGGGRQALALARNLAERGISVNFLTLNIDGQAPMIERHANLTIKRINIPGGAYWQVMLFSFWSAWFLWRNRHQIDVIHYVGAFLNVCPSLCLAYLLKKPTVLKLTAVGVDDPQALRHRRFGRLFLRVLQLVDRIVLTTAEFEQKYAQSSLDPERAVTIANGVDTDYFKPVSPKPTQVRQHLQIPPDAFLVLMVGHVSIGKGVDLLWEAWQQIQKRYLSAHLLIVGEITDDQLGHGEPLSSALRQLPNVHVMPYQLDILAFYQSADLFVLPSRSEGLPNATLEAMAVGLPVILSDIGGHRAIVQAQAGVCFFPNGDVEKLAAALIAQLDQSNHNRLPLHQTRAIILNRFALNDVAQRYIDLYQQLIRNL